MLGFTPFAERPGAILYKTSVGSVFAISRGSALSSGTHTQMAFTVDDIEAAAADLRARGVVFEAYETPKTTDGIATIGAGPGGLVQGPGREPVGDPPVPRSDLTGVSRRGPAAGDAERPELAPREATGDDRVLVHDPARGGLVRRLEDRDPGIDRAEGRTDEDERPVREHPLETLEMDAPDGAFLVGHGRREVLARRVDEVDPLAHWRSRSSRSAAAQPATRAAIARRWSGVVPQQPPMIEAPASRIVSAAAAIVSGSAR